jgi:hypothetical protein
MPRICERGVVANWFCTGDARPDSNPASGHGCANQRHNRYTVTERRGENDAMTQMTNLRIDVLRMTRVSFGRPVTHLVHLWLLLQIDCLRPLHRIALESL